MNTSTTAAYADVDAAAIKWQPSSTEGQLTWDQLNILNLCKDAQRILNSDEHSSAFKVGYVKVCVDFIETTIKAKA
jgi:hypothetical protein